jgi:hypothetical protein
LFEIHSWPLFTVNLILILPDTYPKRGCIVSIASLHGNCRAVFWCWFIGGCSLLFFFLLKTGALGALLPLKVNNRFPAGAALNKIIAAGVAIKIRLGAFPGGEIHLLGLPLILVEVAEAVIGGVGFIAQKHGVEALLINDLNRCTAAHLFPLTCRHCLVPLFTKFDCLQASNLLIFTLYTRRQPLSNQQREYTEQEKSLDELSIQAQEEERGVLACFLYLLLKCINSFLLYGKTRRLHLVPNRRPILTTFL